MDLVVNHTSDEHPWFVESRVRAGQPEARLVLVARRRAPAWSRRARRRADQLALVLLAARRGSSTRRPASTTCTSFSPQAARPQLGEPGGPRRRSTTMMRWWLDRGVDGFRMDVINMISKDPALPDGHGAGRASRRRSRALRLRAAHPRVPAGDAPRGVRRAPERAADRRRDARRHRRGGAAVHRPGARARSTWCSSSSTSSSTRARRKWDVAAARPARPEGVARALAGRPGRASAGTASTGTTTTSRGSVSRFGDDGEHRVAVGEDARARSCTCTAGRRTSTRARSSA